MARPVSYNIKEKPLEKDISMVDMPEGYQGEGFLQRNLVTWLAWPEKTRYGPCLLPLRAAASNLWPPWLLTTTWPGLARSASVFHPASVIF